MRSPMRYAVNRTCRQVARNYTRQQKKNTYTYNKDTSNSNDQSIGLIVGISLFFLLIFIAR